MMSNLETVGEITIVGILKDMFINIEVAVNIELRRATKAPSIRLDCLTLADE